jgi:hypothetical protein
MDKEPHELFDSHDQPHAWLTGALLGAVRDYPATSTIDPLRHSTAQMEFNRT